jgi:N-acetylmuramoyl-L-alanine amidase
MSVRPEARRRPRAVPRATQRACAILAALVLLVATAGLGDVGAARAADPPVVEASVSGSPFRGGSGSRPRVTLHLRLAQRTSLRVEVRTFGGTRVRLLARDIRRDAGSWSFRWNGRDARGRLLPDGPYRFRVTATAGDARMVIERWVTKAPGVPPVPASGSIVVAINPGHGGSDPGATSRGLEEADANLSIARRVQRMLEAAGVVVVMTRTTDRDVNRPAQDVDGNGRIDHRDELVARLDVANLARADLTLNIHNNATACHCASGTETFVDARRPWGHANASLGREVQRALVRRLRRFADRSWRVRDRGVGSGSYVSLSGGAKGGDRPSLMPAILGESLFVDERGDRERLASSAVRTAIAAAYYDGVVAWLRARPLAAHYSRLTAPATVAAGGDATIGVRVRATGRRALTGWRLEARVVPAVAVLDGSGARGRLVGSVALGSLASGKARDLAVPITMPEEPREWLLKLDLVRDGARLSRTGVVQPQLRISGIDP